MAERPTVSLVLLTYNQEAFIADAVDAALAQDFKPLEIIISDDCSTDRTVEIARSRVERSGTAIPVTVRQPFANLGLVRHFFEATALARGDLVVIAAGDDISYPDRVSRLVERWRETDADALFSDWDVIGRDGKILRRGRERSTVRDGIRLAQYFPGQSITHIMGTTSAYSASLLRSIPQLAGNFVAEDFLLTLLTGLHNGRIIELDERLVAYRVHDRAITNVDQKSLSVAEQEARMRQMARWQADQLHAFRDHVSRNSAAATVVDLHIVEQDIAFLEARAAWQDLTLLARTRALLASPEPGWRRWMAPRLFGDRALSIVKWIRGMLPGRRS